MNSLEDLVDEINITLSTLRVPYKKASLETKATTAFEVKELGVVVACIFPEGYSFVLDKLQLRYNNYRYIFVTTSDNLFERKDEIIWEFMRSGYIRYIRTKYQRQFNELIQQGFGRKIIQERLRIWGNQAKYKFLIDENKRCLEIPTSYVLNSDPAFFDYMPEIPFL